MSPTTGSASASDSSNTNTNTNTDSNEGKSTTGLIDIKTFTVEYCFNCDGGGQERDTAMHAITDVIPDAKVRAAGGSAFPITVTIKVKSKEGDEIMVWSKSQKKLFRKYGKDREKSIEEIKQALKALEY